MFEGTLARSNDDNAQLRDFCTHLEGLLATHGSGDAVGENGGVGRTITVDGFGVTECTSSAPFTVADGKRGPFVHHRHRQDRTASTCYPIHGESMAEVAVGADKRGSPLPWPYQQLC